MNSSVKKTCWTNIWPNSFEPIVDTGILDELTMSTIYISCLRWDSPKWWLQPQLCLSFLDKSTTFFGSHPDDWSVAATPMKSFNRSHGPHRNSMVFTVINSMVMTNPWRSVRHNQRIKISWMEVFVQFRHAVPVTHLFFVRCYVNLIIK